MELCIFWSIEEADALVLKLNFFLCIAGALSVFDPVSF